MDCGGNCCYKTQVVIGGDQSSVQTVVAEPNNQTEYATPIREDSVGMVVSKEGKRSSEETIILPKQQPKEPDAPAVKKDRAMFHGVVPVDPSLYPPINNEIRLQQQAEEENFEPPTSCCGLIRYNMEQQTASTITLPMYCFSWGMQVCCGGVCAILLALFGGMAFMAAGDVKELTVVYTYPDRYKTFTVDEDMAGDINMWYDIPGVILNQKRYIENTDSDVIKLMFMGGKKICKDTESQNDAYWRRILREKNLRASTPFFYPDTWSALVQNISAPTFKPCGLQSIAMFSDEYALSMKDGTNWVQQALDESDIYLKKDDDIFNKRIKNENGILMIDGEKSWIKAGNIYNHFKVWMRSPAAPHVRHLWAVKKGGLAAGTYRLEFLQNSAIWTAKKSDGGWGVDEKRVVFSTQNTLGSKGACEIMFVVCFAIAGAEVIALLAFLVMGMTSKSPVSSTV